MVKSYYKRGSYSTQIKIKKLKIILAETHKKLFTVAKKLSTLVEIEIHTLVTLARKSN